MASVLLEAGHRWLFDAFFTTKGAGGTGLGLWVSKEIVERHAGRVHLRSSQRQPGRGTVLAIFLPYDAVDRRETNNQTKAV